MDNTAIAITPLEPQSASERNEITVLEHGEADLPRDIVRADGSFDLYDDVQPRFTIEYRRRRQGLIIRPGGWIGFIPLNQRYALRVETRVPVSNLERVIARGAKTTVHVLDRYTDVYAASGDKPRSLYDVVTDRFLAALDDVWLDGLAKTYVQRTVVTSRPFGRIDPYRTSIRNRMCGEPLAESSAYARTADFGPNRFIKSALGRLASFYGFSDSEWHQRTRSRRIIDALAHLDEISSPAPEDLMPSRLHGYLSRLANTRPAYVEALRLAVLIDGGFGVALRGFRGVVRLPVILINMADVFEHYVRETLRRHVASQMSCRILDGNVAGDSGARDELFSTLDIDDVSNPAVTPDIVIEKDGEALAVLDVKYKPAKVIPDRGEMNQIVCYGVRYNCDKVMIVYPALPDGHGSLSKIGMIGKMSMYRLGIDIGASNLDDEEGRFCDSVIQELTDGGYPAATPPAPNP